MKRFVLFLLLLFPISFQTHADVAQSVENRYNTLKSWSAEFDQTTFVEMLGQTLTKKGKIAVARPDKLRIEYLSNPQKIYVSDGKKMWIYKEDEDTAWQFDKAKNVLSEEALSFLSGLQNMSSLFDIVPDLKDTDDPLKIKNKKLKKVFLIPKKQDALLKITLGVDPKDMTVKEAVLFNTSGNTTHYSFHNVQFDQNLNSSLFVLPKTPKRKIIKK